jgi:hypothetical protein
MKLKVLDTWDRRNEYSLAYLDSNNHWLPENALHGEGAEVYGLIDMPHRYSLLAGVVVQSDPDITVIADFEDQVRTAWSAAVRNRKVMMLESLWTGPEASRGRGHWGFWFRALRAARRAGHRGCVVFLRVVVEDEQGLERYRRMLCPRLEQEVPTEGPLREFVLLLPGWLTVVNVVTWDLVRRPWRRLVGE